jgi:hypothetical protein
VTVVALLLGQLFFKKKILALTSASRDVSVDVGMPSNTGIEC